MSRPLCVKVLMLICVSSNNVSPSMVIVMVKPLQVVKYPLQVMLIIVVLVDFNVWSLMLPLLVEMKGSYILMVPQILLEGLIVLLDLILVLVLSLIVFHYQDSHI